MGDIYGSGSGRRFGISVYFNVHFDMIWNKTRYWLGDTQTVDHRQITKMIKGPCKIFIIPGDTSKYPTILRVTFQIFSVKQQYIRWSFSRLSSHLYIPYIWLLSLEKTQVLTSWNHLTLHQSRFNSGYGIWNTRKN
jgi:hypothetical protein